SGHQCVLAPGVSQNDWHCVDVSGPSFTCQFCLPDLKFLNIRISSLEIHAKFSLGNRKEERSHACSAWHYILLSQTGRQPLDHRQDRPLQPINGFEHTPALCRNRQLDSRPAPVSPPL